MGNAEGGNECECCGCAIVSDPLTGSSIPAFLSVSSGSWTASGSGLRTTSTGAKLMCVAPPTSSPYKGVSAQITVAGASDGDVFVWYFNGSWQARATFGSGGKLEIYNGSSLMTSQPYAGTGGDTFTLCVCGPVNTGISTVGTDHGNSVFFSGSAATVDSYCGSVTTLAVGFGSGATNAGGLKFTNFALLETDFTDESGNLDTDPLVCGVCGCPRAAAVDNAASMEAREFTLNLGGFSQQAGSCSTADCADCSQYNTSIVATYGGTFPGGGPSDGWSQWVYTSGVIALGTSCNGSTPITAQLWVQIIGAGCASQIQWTYELDGACADITGGGNVQQNFNQLAPASIAPFAAANLAAINAWLASIAGDGLLGGLACLPADTNPTASLVAS